MTGPNNSHTWNVDAENSTPMTFCTSVAEALVAGIYIQQTAKSIMLVAAKTRVIEVAARSNAVCCSQSEVHAANCVPGPY
jgi:hypothetical protein